MDQFGKSESMLIGWFVHYNFLRPHSALGGKTPAEVAGIEVDITNRWESLIEQVIKWKNTINPTLSRTVKIGQMAKINY